MDLAGNEESIQELEIIIDRQAPVVSANVSSGTYKDNQIVSLSSSKDGTLYYSVDGSEPSTSSLRYTSPIEIGQTSI